MNTLQIVEKDDRRAHAIREPMPVATGTTLYRCQSEWFGIVRTQSHTDKNLLRTRTISHQQYAALLEIRCQEDPEVLTIGTLAQRLGIRHNTVVSAINRLVSLELVERIQSSRDRRKVHLRLTQYGLDAVDRYVRSNLQSMNLVRTTVAKIIHASL